MDRAFPFVHRRRCSIHVIALSRKVSGVDITLSPMLEFPSSQGKGVMALELRPYCECCDKDLAPDAVDARICSYECTFCAACVDTVLLNVCPNCGGGFVPRPIRPRTEWRPGASLSHQPADTRRRALKWTRQDMAAHSRRIKDIPPGQR
jgi:uncharacterized protein